MTNKEIFQELLNVAAQTKSERGAVAACLVRNGVILLSSPSSDSPNRHAEDLLLEKIKKERISILPDDIVYATLQPCGARTRGGGGEEYGDCTTKIIHSPVKHIIYALPDHHYSLEVNKRFEEAGISSHQTDDPEITEHARKIFNESMTDEKYIEQKGDKAFL